jgi:rhamnulokinase
LRAGDIISGRAADSGDDGAFDPGGWRIDGSISEIKDLQSIEFKNQKQDFHYAQDENILRDRQSVSSTNTNHPQDPKDRRALVAVDLGAESCRVSLLRWTDAGPVMQLVHRFPNASVERYGQLRWNLTGILSGVSEGLRLCAMSAPEGIRSVGVDGWAVDYVRLGSDDKPLDDPYCYRDVRNVAAEAEVHKIIAPEKLRALTGVQLMRLNTIYQLYADKMAGQSAVWMNLPEYVLHWLGGRVVAEYTNATHTGLVRLGKAEWCEEIFEELGLLAEDAPQIVATGTDVGKLSNDLSVLKAFHDTRLIAPACHDTASAIAGIPASGDDWAYISSGTWSLVGRLLDAPENGAEASALNFTNIGAAGGRICFHKNVNGMWLLRQSLEYWKKKENREWSVTELIAAAEKLPGPKVLLDVDDEELQLPGDMPLRINKQRKRKGLAALDTKAANAPEIAALIFHSLAARYAGVLNDVQRITGKKLKRLFIVGGGSKNGLLNKLTAKASGLEVRCGAVESTTLGNFAVQMAALEHGGVETVAAWAADLQSACEKAG